MSGYEAAAKVSENVSQAIAVVGCVWAFMWFLVKSR